MTLVFYEGSNMQRIALLYTPESKPIAEVTYLIQEQIDWAVVELFDLNSLIAENVQHFKVMFLGAPVCGFKGLDVDIEDLYPALEDLSFFGKKVAHFGACHRCRFSNTQADYLFFAGDTQINKALVNKGARLLSTNEHTRHFNPNRIQLAGDCNKLPKEQALDSWLYALKAELLGVSQKIA